MEVKIQLGDKGRGKLITLTYLDNETADDIKNKVQAFIQNEQADVHFNLWDMRGKGQDFTIDIYVEDDRVLHRLEDYLSIFGYRMRLTPKKIVI